MKGLLTRDEALSQLLANTNLEVASSSDTTVTLRISVANGSGSSSGAGDEAQASAEVIVTGTRIRNARPTSSVHTISRKDIARSGYSQIGDSMRSVPENFSGGQNPGVYQAVFANENNANGWARGGKTYDEIGAIDRMDSADCRHVQASLEAGVDLVVSMGIADPSKAGLTGFSDGASTAQFAMINSDRFAAMIVSSCCENTLGVNALVGPAIGSWLNTLGYPDLTEESTRFWQASSLRQNLERVRFPLLIQAGEDEYLGALEDYTALRQSGRPIEMFVFPDKHHIKSQPMHRLAAYLRGVDWFEYWLNENDDRDSDESEHYKRWRALRNPTTLVTSATPG